MNILTLFTPAVDKKEDKPIIRERIPVDGPWDDHFGPVGYDGARLLNDLEVYELTFKSKTFYSRRNND